MFQWEYLVFVGFSCRSFILYSSSFPFSSHANTARYAVTALKTHFSTPWAMAIIGKNSASEIKAGLNQLAKNYRAIASSSYQSLLSWKVGRRSFNQKSRKTSSSGKIFTGYKRSNYSQSGSSKPAPSKASKKFQFLRF